MMPRLESDCILELLAGVWNGTRHLLQEKVRIFVCRLGHGQRRAESVSTPKSMNSGVFTAFSIKTMVSDDTLCEEGTEFCAGQQRRQ